MIRAGALTHTKRYLPPGCKRQAFGLVEGNIAGLVMPEWSASPAVSREPMHSIRNVLSSVDLPLASGPSHHRTQCRDSRSPCSTELS